MSSSGNPVLDRLLALEYAVFGGSGPGISGGGAKIQPFGAALIGSADALNNFGIYIIDSPGVDAMTIVAPLPGGPQVGHDWQSLTVYDAGGHAHTVTTPPNAINGNKHIATFNGTVVSFVTFVAFNGVLYMFANSGIALS